MPSMNLIVLALREDLSPLMLYLPSINTEMISFAGNSVL
jgi:hypothetical protein